MHIDIANTPSHELMGRDELHYLPVGGLGNRRQLRQQVQNLIPFMQIAARQLPDDHAVYRDTALIQQFRERIGVIPA